MQTKKQTGTSEEQQQKKGKPKTNMQIHAVVLSF